MSLLTCLSLSETPFAVRTSTCLLSSAVDLIFAAHLGLVFPHLKRRMNMGSFPEKQLVIKPTYSVEDEVEFWKRGTLVTQGFSCTLILNVSLSHCECCENTYGVHPG